MHPAPGAGPDRPRILLTGFEPFDGEPVNASWEAVRMLDGAVVEGHGVQACCLPTAFEASSRALRAALRAVGPAVVVAVGQAGGRDAISLERVALNLVDARIPDNDGDRPIDRAVVADGPAAYFSTLPLKPMRKALQDAGLPVEISHTAGTYVCNHVFYILCHALRERPEVAAGFVHVPLLDTQAARHPGAPSMPLDAVVQALRILLRAAIDPPGIAPGTSAGREA